MTEQFLYTYVYSPIKATCQTYKDREKQTIRQTDRQTDRLTGRLLWGTDEHLFVGRTQKGGSRTAIGLSKVMHNTRVFHVKLYFRFLHKEYLEVYKTDA